MNTKNYSFVVLMLIVALIFWFYGMSITPSFDYTNVELGSNNMLPINQGSKLISDRNNTLPTNQQTTLKEEGQHISYVISSHNEINVENRVNDFNGAMDLFSDYFYHQDSCKRMSDVVKKNNPSIAVSAIQQRTFTRLGNQLSNFASGYAIWRDFGILNYVDPEQLAIIGKVFKLPTYNESDSNASYYVWRKGM